MLDPWIIEEIRRREKEERRQQEEQRPMIEIPSFELPTIPTGKPADENEERGVVIVDFRI